MPRWFRRRGHVAQVTDSQWFAIQGGVERARESRRELLVGQEDLVADLEAILFRHDPIGINFGENTDEYRSEAETIAIRLPEAGNEHDVLRIVHEEFVRWFDAAIAGGVERYADAGHEIWVRHQGQ